MIHTTSKSFKIVSVSSNRNSFGLRGMVIVARDGEAWQVGTSNIQSKKAGDFISINISETGERDFAEWGFEIPEKLPPPPAAVLAELGLA